MNNVCLIGRLTRDPELRYTPNGAAVVRFTLAVDRRLSKERRAEAQATNQQTADFITCTAWNKTAELIANYVPKGRRIAVQGRIQTGSYEKDGQRIYTTEVVVETMDFIESAQQGQNMSSGGFNQGGFNQGGFSQGGYGASNPVNSAYSNTPEENGFDDDLGFKERNEYGAEDVPF